MMNLFDLHKIHRLLIAALLGLAGCDADIRSFGENELLAKRLELTNSVEMSQPVEDVSRLLERRLGTPDEPNWPSILADRLGTDGLTVTQDSLQRSAGPVSSDEMGRHFGLYREHCVVCHGIDGNGRGPSAGLLNPYPRDFRLGKFKFKSTPIGSKPTRDDLRRILTEGIDGTSMASFQLLDEADIESLIDYVIYLSIRGEVERKLLLEAATELDVERGERIFDPRWESKDPERFQEALDLVDSLAVDVYEDWLTASEQVTPVPNRPENLPVFDPSIDLDDGASDVLAQSVARGRTLFQGNVAACAFCHGPEAKGNGQQNNYDDWTRDWTVLAGLNPGETTDIEPMLELGALKPRNILPRNLRLGVFRGGGRPEDLYRRIVNGIEGTPMPAAPMKPNNPQGLTETDVWDLVNFLLSLPHQEENKDSGAVASSSAAEMAAGNLSSAASLSSNADSKGGTNGS